MKQPQMAQCCLMLNSHYINIGEKTYGKKPSHSACDSNVSGTTQAIDLIVQLYLDQSF